MRDAQGALALNDNHKPETDKWHNLKAYGESMPRIGNSEVTGGCISVARSPDQREQPTGASLLSGESLDLRESIESTTPLTQLGLLGETVIELGNGWRVAYDPLQWMLQRYQGGRWRDRSFCCTRAGLLRCISEHCGEVDVTEVMRLPEWHPDRVAANAEAPALPVTPTEPVTGLLPASLPLEEAA
jgi:hypothetical protein